MSEQKPIKPSDLAHHWGCSPSNVSNLVKRKGMPAFTSLAQADEWRAVHAPLRKQPENSAKKDAEAGKKNARVSVTTSGTTTKDAPPEQKSAEEPWPPPPLPPERIDVESFIDPAADFDGLMIKQSAELPQIAYGLLKRKMAGGDPGAISAANRNWHETSKAAADVRERFVSIQKETRALIQIDDVFDVLGSELQEIRKALSKLGERYGPLANPDNPALACRVIDAGVDAAFSKYALILERVAIELKPEDQPAAAAS